MPVIAVANARSLQPKMSSTIEKVENEEIDILLVCEVWEKLGKKNKYFKGKIEEMLQIKGYKYISCGARPSGKRGGGAAIVVNTKRFTLEELEVAVPHNIEAKWGLVRPKKVERNTKYKEYIVCCFYSPPNSKKNKKMLDHLIMSSHALMTKFPNAALILGGDKNSLPLGPLLDGQTAPKCTQTVASPTHGNKVIDVIVMNCAQFYGVPEITRPLLPAHPVQAAPSAD